MFAEAKNLRPDAYWAQNEFVRSVNKVGGTCKDSVAMATFCRVYEKYAEPLIGKDGTKQPRAYHTFDHVLDLLGWWRMNSFLHTGREIAFFAILYHDCEYFVDGSGRSESASAAFSIPELFSLGIDHQIVSVVAREILTTEYSQDRDSQFFVRDYDLVNLARDWNEVALDSEKIRQEYAHVSDADFYQGRKRFFEGFKDRRIYQSGIFQQVFSNQARQNIELIIAECNQKLISKS